MSTPADDGFFMPAEWVRHTRTWMAWPYREALWGERIDEVRDAYAEVAKAIAAFEPVTMVVNPENVAEVSIKCGSGVAVLPMPHDDSWLRDSGPTFLIDGFGNVAATDWVFNSWGERFKPYDQDAALAEAMLAHLHIDRYACPLVTEGGAIHVDGEGTLLAVEETLLNDNRNPGKSREEIESLLLAYTGAKKMIWLPGGLENDHTDGHVDNVACFVKPGVVVAMVAEDPEDGNHAPLQANLDILKGETDAKGRPLEVVELPQPKARMGLDGGRLALSYVNFYFANGGLILPEFGDPADNKAFDIFEELFPERQIVQIPVIDILHGGGGIHCITQQQPVGTGEVD